MTTADAARRFTIPARAAAISASVGLRRGAGEGSTGKCGVATVALIGLGLGSWDASSGELRPDDEVGDTAAVSLFSQIFLSSSYSSCVSHSCVFSCASTHHVIRFLARRRASCPLHVRFFNDELINVDGSTRSESTNPLPLPESKP